MKKLTLFIIPLLTLLGCGGSAGQFRLCGDFDHLEQGEFYIYSPDGGLDRLDTLRLREGKFDYTVPLQEKATYHILYPNFSELVIFGESGKVVKVKGDARSLNEVKVSGTDENETYTKYRRESQNLSGKKLDSLTRDYILQYPTMQMSRFLLNKYFIQPEGTDQQMMHELYDSLCRANPSDVFLSNLSNDVRRKNTIKTGSRIPEFSLTTRKVELKKYKNKKTIIRTIESRTVSDTSYKDKPLLLVFWATWRSGSQSGLYRASRLMRESENKIQAISYSLDVEDTELKAVERRDSIDYPSICDFKCWNSPLVQQWGIRELPFFILMDKDRKILAFGTNWSKDIEPHTKEYVSKTE
ncbi:MAG: DUF4369 domain-containing protein [Bacteroidaceae bacterium]|nr:DUF4369 domain-containing protein [Bacteroidaceae bacterium]